MRTASTRLLFLVVLLWGLAIPVAALFATDTIRTVSFRPLAVNDVPLLDAGRTAFEVAGARIGLREESALAAVHQPEDDGTSNGDSSAAEGR